MNAGHPMFAQLFQEAMKPLTPEEQKKRKRQLRARRATEIIIGLLVAFAMCIVTAYFIMVILGAIWHQTGIGEPFGYTSCLLVLLLIETITRYFHVVGIMK